MTILLRVYWPWRRAFHAAFRGAFPNASKVKALGTSGKKKSTCSNRAGPAASSRIRAVEK